MTLLCKMKTWAMARVFCCAVSFPVLGDIILVEAGKARCTIVMGPERSLCRTFLEYDTPAFSNLVTYAGRREAGGSYTRVVAANELPESAADLADHLNEMAQIRDPADRVRVVENREQAQTPYRILLGSVAVKEYGLEEEAESLPHPAYIYRVVGNDLLIFGSSPKGTANGIYGFLQEELGVRWFGPQDIFRAIPKRQTVAVKAVNRRVVPSFPGRRFYVNICRQNPEYVWGRRRMRMGETVDDGEPFINTSHNLCRILPIAVYATEHPEYYPLRGGKRETSDYQNWSPCFSNPEVANIAANAARSFFAADRLFQSFALGINDTGQICQCEKCLHPPQGPWFHGDAPTHSDVYFHCFVNEVARRVRQEFPDRYIGVIAYNDVAHAPAGPVEPNVHAVITSDIAQYFDPAYRSEEEKRIRAWEAKGCTLGLYFYMGQAALRPIYCPHLLAREIKDKYHRGFRSITVEAGTYWPFGGPMTYVVAQLLWNVDQDVDGLLKEYFATLYGPAAGPMSRLYDLFEEIHMRPRHSGFLYEHSELAQFRPVKTADAVRMRALLAEARKAAPDGVIAQRVAYVVHGMEVPLTMMEAYSTAQELPESARMTTKTALARLESVKRMVSILENHDALWKQTVSDETLSPILYTFPYPPEGQYPTMRNGWKVLVSTAIGDSLAALYRWKNENQPGRAIGKQIQGVVDAYTADDYHRAIFRVKAGAAQFGPNLVENPGFEERTATGKHPIGPDWEPFADADGWSRWRHNADKGIFDLSEKEQHGGRYAARIAGADLGGCYITTISNVKEGECYHAGVWVKNLGGALAEPKSGVSLEIAWFDEEGSWTRGAENFRRPLTESGKWTQLEILAQVPKGVSAAVLLLHVKGLEAQQEVVFDDVTFQKDTGGRLPTADFGPNLLKNGGFEAIWGEAPHDVDYPPGKRKGFPYAWDNGWGGTRADRDKGIMDTVESDPHTGRRAARMRGGWENAFFMQYPAPFDSSPGLYLCEAWAKNLSASANTLVYLEIRWRGSEGWMEGGSYFKVPLKAIGTWSRMEIIAQPPEGASAMAFMLFADNLGPDDEVLFDDAAVRRMADG